MTEMSITGLKCSLAVILFTCAFYVGSDGYATDNGGSSSAFSSASASASAFTGAIGGTATHDGHKGIRSYDGTSFSHDNDANRGTKSYGTRSGHDAGNDHGIKGGGHNYNENDDSCSKCKWENDDYWERDEPEEEEGKYNEDECDDGDDGQYKHDKIHHHGASGSGREHKPVLRPPGVHKTGPTGVYTDSGDKGRGSSGAPFGSIFPTTSNTQFTDASKPEYGSVGTFGITPNSRPGWNRGTTPSGFSTSLKSAWNGAYPEGVPAGSRTTPKPGTSWNSGSDTPTTGFLSPKKSAPNWNTGLDGTSTGEFPSSQKPGASWNIGHDGGSLGTTPKTIQGWNAGLGGTPIGGFPSSQKPGAPWNIGHDGGNLGTTPKPGQGWNTGLGGTSTGGFPSSQKPGAPWNIGHDGGSLGTTPKPGQGWNTGLDGTSTGGFPSSQKPGAPWNIGHNGGSLGTTPKPGQGWNTGLGGTSTGGFSSSQKPGAPWNVGHDDGSLGTTSKPGQDWNIGFSGKPESSWSPGYGMPVGTVGCTRSDASCNQGKQIPVKIGATPVDIGLMKSGESPSNVVPHTGSGAFSPDSYGNTQENQNLPYGQPGTQNTNSYVGTSVISGIKSPSHEAVPDFGKKNHPFGFDKSAYTPSPHDGKPHGGIDQTHSNTGSGTYGPGGTSDYNKPEYGSGLHGVWPSSVANGFGITKGPYEEISSSSIIPGFGTTKTPSGHHLSTSNPTISDSTYRGTGPKQLGFNVISSSATANAAANAFSTSLGAHTTASIPRTMSFGSTSAHGRGSDFPGVNSPFESTRSSYGVTLQGAPSDAETGPWHGKQPGNGSGTWLSGHSGVGSGTQPSGQSGKSRGPWPSGKPGDGSGIASGGHPGIEREAWLSKQPKDGGGSDEQSEYEKGFGCPKANCGGTNNPHEGNSNCGSGNYNCGGGCSGRDNNAATVHRPCVGVVGGLNSVNKVYYPAGTGDGNVPSIENIYGPSTPPNIITGTNTICRSGDNSCNQVGDKSATSGSPVQWNSANPFLYGSGGSIPNDVSRPWSSGTTAKPIGKGNPFLDSSWSSQQPGSSSSNANDNRNIIPLGNENTKPIGQGNPFLDDNKGSGSGNTGSSSPLYDGQPDGSSGLRIPESNYGIKSGSHPGGVPSQNENSGRFYPEGNPQNVGLLQCKLGIFGCGTSGSRSYATTTGDKHPGRMLGGIGGNVKVGSGALGSIDNVLGGSGNPGTGIGPISGHFDARSPGSNLATSVASAHAGAYAGSFSNAQASSSSLASAKSLPFADAIGSGNDFGQVNSGSWSPSGVQNQNRPNSWASSGASAFASSDSGSWSGNHPTGVKG